jgi:phosphohistidine phosphatase
MIKILTLIRHAKSSWKDESLLDLDRPLNRRGRRDAPIMGQRLAARESYADLMISSPAARALATAEAIAEAIEYPEAEIVVDERLYGADAFEWIEVIQGLDDGWDRVMCVGHNPGLTDLVDDLSPDPIGNVPTCGVVELKFDTDSWALVGRVEPAAVDFYYPKRTHS